MKERFIQMFSQSALASKIRYSYMVLLVPIVLFLIYCFYNLWDGNRNYGDMINSTVVASDFSLDFKKDFDYEAYLLIVENKSPQESRLDEMLQEANRVVDGLAELTTSEENSDRITSAKKYLDNLATYKNRIIENLHTGNKYEENIEIWENDIQIVTSLLRETIIGYISYEISIIQESHANYQMFFQSMITFAGIAFAVIVILTVYMSYRIPLGITRPLRHLTEVTEQVARGDLTVRSDVDTADEVGRLGESMNVMIDKINELLEQVTMEQTRLRKAEFELLQSQINPHFLYNTLDAIVWLAEAGEQKRVVSMVGSLSEFFRMSLNQGRDIVTIHDEIGHVRSYLEIQQVRYQDILQYEIMIPEIMEKYLIPKISIQPLVENALYHGIKNKRGPGKIIIRGIMEPERIVIEVEDNGIGMTEERLKKVRQVLRMGTVSEDVFGLYNVHERIRLNFGEDYGAVLTSVYGEGTVVSLRLPYQESKS